MMNDYVRYAIYKSPEKPTEQGEYIGGTPVLEQALKACERAKTNGKSYFIKGIKKNGTEVLFI